MEDLAEQHFGPVWFIQGGIDTLKKLLENASLQKRLK